MSSEAKSILKDLELTLTNFTSYNSKFVDDIANLHKRVLSLKDEKEFIIVGSAISIAAHSYSYWQDNASKWIDLLNSNNFKMNKLSIISTQAIAPCKINLYKLGGADVAGAVNGAIDLSELGPGGAFAGAVLGSAVSSSYNMINQVITCNVPWWPF